MNLNELKGIKAGAVDSTYQDFITALAEKHGIDIGEGMQAKVLILPDKQYVYRLWYDDPGYEQFLEFVEDHKSEHLPKIFSKPRTLDLTFKRLPKDMKLKVVKLERLTPINDAELRHAIEMFQELKFRMSFAKLDALTFDDFVEVMTRDPGSSHGTDFLKSTAKTKDTILKYRSFFELCLSMTKIANDIIPDNVMMRDSVPVLVDPIS